MSRGYLQNVRNGAATGLGAMAGMAVGGAAMEYVVVPVIRRAWDGLTSAWTYLFYEDAPVRPRRKTTKTTKTKKTTRNTTK